MKDTPEIGAALEATRLEAMDSAPARFGEMARAVKRLVLWSGWLILPAWMNQPCAPARFR